MPLPITPKQALVEFYAAEARDRETDAWLRAGGGPRVPENAASRYFLDRKVSAALALAPAEPSAKVLEVGCSFGHQSFLLARRFAHVTAVDLSPESIALARRRAEFWKVANVRFEVADAEALSGHADDSYDAVYSFSTLRFCPDPLRALREFHRVLRPGGALGVDFPNALCPWYGPLKRSLGIAPHVHDRLFGAKEAVALVRDAGFASVRLGHLLFTSKRTPAVTLPAFRLLDALGERLPGIRERSGILMVGGVKHGEC